MWPYPVARGLRCSLIVCQERGNGFDENLASLYHNLFLHNHHVKLIPYLRREKWRQKEEVESMRGQQGPDSARAVASDPDPSLAMSSHSECAQSAGRLA